MRRRKVRDQLRGGDASRPRARHLGGTDAMKNRTLIPIAAAAVLTSLSFASEGRAGRTAQEALFCASGTTWGGYCQGTFADTRNASDPQEYVQFYLDGSGGAVTWEFSAVYNNTWYTCSTTTDNPINAAANGIVAGRGWFYVVWDTNGECNTLLVGPSSMYNSTW
jgi:hypothetical protein